jgi:hypothetical protein
MALTKVARTDLLAIVSTASNAVTLSSAVDVSTYYSADIRIRMGRGTGTAFTVGPKVRIEVSAVNGAPTADQWAVLATFQMALGASIASQAFSGSEAAAQTTLSLAAATNFAAGDYVFIHDNTIGSSEWARVVSVSGSDIVVEEGIVNAHDTSDTVRDQSEQYHCVVDLTGIHRLRAVVDGAGSGQAVIAHIDYGAVSGL